MKALEEPAVDDIIFCERSLDSAVAFSTVASITDTMAPEELVVVQNLCGVLKGALPPGHTFSSVRLACDTTTLLNRVKERARSGEEALDLATLDALDVQFEKMNAVELDVTDKIPSEILEAFLRDHMPEISMRTWM